MTLTIALVSLFLCLFIEACVFIELDRRFNGGENNEETQSA